MASVTFTIDPATLEAAQLVAVQRKTSLDKMVSDYVAGVAQESERTVSVENLVRLMNEGVLGHIERPMTREEIYTERSWPRS